MVEIGTYMADVTAGRFPPEAQAPVPGLYPLVFIMVTHPSRDRHHFWMLPIQLVDDE
jgi:hypothetical protein